MPMTILRRPVALVAIVSALAAIAVLLALGAGGLGGPSPAKAGNSPGVGVAAMRPTAAIAVDTAARGQAVPAGFLGLSIEYTALERYTGANPDALDPVFLRLVENLSPGQDPVVRIGGDSTDHTWWPVAGIRQSPGLRYSLTPEWAAVARSFARATHARLVLGIDLEADSERLAKVEASQLVNRIGPGSIVALELGNEPELYRSYGWYMSQGRPVHGRPRSYTPSAFSRQFSQFGAVLPRQVALAGPAIGGAEWLTSVPRFVAGQPRLGLVTIHRYPLELCGLPSASPQSPSIAHLLSSASTVGLASGVIPYVHAAHARGLPIRVDELNSISCGGRTGVSDAFASALWSLETMFALARAGVDGVNIHTYPGANYQPFILSDSRAGWRAVAEPEYYGLLLFAQATPRGSRLLPVTGGSAAELRSWAVRGPEGRVRVALVNTSPTTSQVVAIAATPTPGAATIERLQASSMSAGAGVTLAGQSVDAQTGELAGTPRVQTVPPRDGRYVVMLPAASAALVTLPSARS